MTDRYNNNNNTLPNNPDQGQDQYNADTTNRGNLAASDNRSEGLGPAPSQDYPTTRSSHLGSQLGGDPRLATNQSADPDFDPNDPARGRFDDQTRFSGPDGGQNRGQLDQQGQWQQGGRTVGENVPYGGDGRQSHHVGHRDPHRGGRRDQVVGDPQERFNSPTYGTSTGTGPGSRPDDQDIRGDGGFGTKPPIPERVIGTAEKIIGKATGNARMYEHGLRHKDEGY